MSNDRNGRLVGPATAAGAQRRVGVDGANYGPTGNAGMGGGGSMKGEVGRRRGCSKG